MNSAARILVILLNSHAFNPLSQDNPCESSIFKAITVDNGSKFANLAEALPTLPAYLYALYERSPNEKQNS